MSLSFIVLILVFLGISLRQIFRIPLKIWQIMSGGALVVLLSSQISLSHAWAAIDWNIILFLFGMFVVGQALEESAFLIRIANRYFLGRNSDQKLAFMIVFGMGIASAILMNDTLAIIGTPILLKVANQRKIPAGPLLLGLAFSITIGSVMTPIGNPQNLFIALGGQIPTPFITFFLYLAIPTLINLALTYFLVLFFIRKGGNEHVYQEEEIEENPKLIKICKLSFVFIFLMIAFNMGASFLGGAFAIPLYLIALLPALLIFIFGQKRKEIFLKLDWHTLIFFIAMFILMESVWETSLLKEQLFKIRENIVTVPKIMSFSILLSQVISNVPLVAIFLPLIKQSMSTALFMALAAGSTIAGNFLVFGAASNLIIIQNVEKRNKRGICIFDFAKYGTPLTLLNFLVYWGYLSLFHV